MSEDVNLWGEATKLWNFLDVGEKVTYKYFSEGFGGKDFSDEVRKTTYSFINSMVKSKKANKIGEREKAVFVKVYDYKPKKKKADGTVSKNVIIILNELNFNQPFTIKDIRNIYKNKFNTKISNNRINLILYNGCNHGYFTKKKKGRTVEYTKTLQIPLPKIQLLTEKRTKTKKKKTNKSISNISNKPEKINSYFSPDRKNLNKQITEDFFLSVVSRYIKNKIRCLVISGPDYKRHVNKLFATIARKVYVVEIQNKVFEKILTEAKSCPFYDSNLVKLINSDVNDIIVKNSRYADIDLMRSLPSSFATIKEQVDTQKITVGNKIKFMSFSACIRSDGGKRDRLVFLRKIMKEVFGANLLGFQGEGVSGFSIVFNNKGKKDGLNFCHKKIPIFDNYGSIVETHMFTYGDGSPMITVLVVYF